MKKLARFVFALSLFAAGSAQAAGYSFSCLSNNNAANCADGAGALAMDVSDAGGGFVDFTFRNFSTRGSSITEVYFDDGTLLGISILGDSGKGVNFSLIKVDPKNLPAGNTAFPPFQVTAGFSADAEKNTKDGVQNALDGGRQEFLTIRFELLSGKSFGDTIAALNTPGDHLRVGLHVRGFENGGSESFLHVAQAPEPETWALMLAGLGLIAVMQRRRDHRADEPRAAQ